MAAYSDLDQLAADTLQLVEDIQAIDPDRTFEHLTRRCEHDPARMAQVVMLLAIWMDPDVSLSVLGQRAEALAGGRLGKAVSA
ncbi:hypothetical protein [Nocardia sp. MH4]|uniref:hypothetical protein n=1 Tax=Nocardia sp. MH4 TaxID=1768677 RepID=UPI001C4F1ACA|nr:hypothetical protein [Nocardia sp. MH4]